MQPHALFEPMLAFDLTQVGATKARCLALVRLRAMEKSFTPVS